jgi:hypothetical protein
MVAESKKAPALDVGEVRYFCGVLWAPYYNKNGYPYGEIDIASIFFLGML